MPRPLRLVPDHSLVEVTTRTIQGSLLLRPSSELTDIILGIIGKAQALYGMEHRHHGSKLSLARKIATIALVMWKTEEEYDSSKLNKTVLP
jgi:hypothetical protein